MPLKGQLFIISGPSGVGKGTLVNAIIGRLPNVEVSVSATTRPPRPGDVDGVTYHFLSDAQFDRELSQDGFLEWAEVHGQRYGTLLSEVNRILASGKDLILEIDTQGNEIVRSKIPQAISIFIAPPSLKELEQRLLLRQTEDCSKIKQRLKAAELELKAKDSYNVVILNEDLDTAIQELVDCISSYHNHSES
jgi:guanylate kinase